MSYVFNNNKQIFYFVISFLVAIILTLLLQESSFSQAQTYVLFLLVFSVGLWLTEAVAEQTTDEDFSNGLIYPDVKNILKVSTNVAVKIVEEIFNSDLAGIKKPRDIRKFIKGKMYKPVYKPGCITSDNTASFCKTNKTLYTQ